MLGEFVTAQKLSPRCLALWRAILDRVPRAVLLFSPSAESDYAGFRRQLAGRFVVDSSRHIGRHATRIDRESLGGLGAAVGLELPPPLLADEGDFRGLKRSWCGRGEGKLR